jgi:hypothetical protein
MGRELAGDGGGGGGDGGDGGDGGGDRSPNEHQHTVE